MNKVNDFSQYLPVIMGTQPYLSTIGFSVLVRIFYANLQGIDQISGKEFQDVCNISKNTVTKAVDELSHSSCITAQRYSRRNPKYQVDLVGCKIFIEEESRKASNDESDTEDSTQFSRVAIRPSLKKVIFERDMYRCVNCGTHKSLCIDHIIPVSRGGGNEIKNLQTLCSTCNRDKSDKTMYEWLKEQE